MGHAVYRFSSFKVDTREHALFADSTRLPIQEQPFQVLLALLENPGRIVTRDTLRVRLWGNNTFVDFDQSLNSALRRLRLALKDDSRHPLYIETIPRVGFRFLAQVSTETETPPAAAPSDGFEPATLLKGTTPVPPAERPSPRVHGTAGAVATLAFVAGILVGALPSQWKRFTTPPVPLPQSALSAATTDRTPSPAHAPSVSVSKR